MISIEHRSQRDSFTGLFTKSIGKHFALVGTFAMCLLWGGLAEAGPTVFTSKKGSRETKNKCNSRLSNWASSTAKSQCSSKSATLGSITKKYCKKEKKIGFTRYRAYVSFTCKSKSSEILYSSVSRRNGSVPFICSKVYENWWKINRGSSEKLTRTCEGWGKLRGQKKYYAATHTYRDYICQSTTGANNYSKIRIKIYCKKYL